MPGLADRAVRGAAAAAPQEPQAVYTPAEAAAYARVSLWAIREAYRRGHLRVVRPIGHRHPKVLHADLMRWIQGLPPQDSQPAQSAVAAAT